MKVFLNFIRWAKRYGLLLFFLMGSLVCSSQYFGRNKVNYDRFDFKVLRTPNFDIYTYLADTAARKRFAQRAEQWYKMHQAVFRDTFKYRNPLILYNNHAHFQQTSAISGLIDPGTGGVTEALKNRVVLPFMESNAQTDHVLGHELVHAFQYSLLRNVDSLSFVKAMNNLPLWMVEGLAEYMSIGYVDPLTALWLRNAVINNKLPTLKDLTTKPYEYFPYRWGQAFWAYVTGLWGDTIIRPLFIKTASLGYERAIETVLKMNEKVFSEKWKESMTNSFAPYKSVAISGATGKSLINKANGGRTNIVPCISPDGKWIAFWAERDVFTFDLYLADATTGKVLRKITSDNLNSHIDNYNNYESSLAWSPDSRHVGFVAFSKGHNQLIIADVYNKRNRHEMEIPGVESFSNPAWSPDGHTIVVSGLVNGQSDLYAFDLDTRHVKALTHDLYSDLQPSFSSDGKWIVFSTDRRSVANNLFTHQFSHDIALLEVETGKVRVFDLFDKANNLNPVFGPGDQTIYFLSDRDGFRNLYSCDVAGDQLSQRTHLFTGITGITLYSPAISISRQTGMVAYSCYFNNEYIIYRSDVNELAKTDADKNQGGMLAAILPPVTRLREDIVERNIKTIFPLVPDSSFSVLNYRPKLQLDYLGNTGTGISISRYGTGMAGGINALFSDMLGNHQLYGSFSLNGDVYDAAGQFLYYNTKRRINWGVGYSHIPYYSGMEWIGFDSIQIGDKKRQVLNHSIDKLRTFEEQVTVLAAYPFSQTRRLEIGGSFSRYHYNLERFTEYYDDSSGYLIGFEHKRHLPVPKGFDFGNVYLSWVDDNSYFGLTSPLRGHRYRLEAAQYFGIVNAQTLLADYRRYFRMAPFTLAIRNMFYGRFGKDADNGALSPLYLGYPWLIRGYDVNNFTRKNQNFSLDINDLTGNKIYVANAELRLPLTGPERLSVIKSRLLITELALFTDGGTAWGFNGSLTDSKQDNRKSNKVFVLSSGVSLRINLFGYMIIEPYYVIPWQIGGWSNSSFGLNLLPGW